MVLMGSRQLYSSNNIISHLSFCTSAKLPHTQITCISPCIIIFVICLCRHQLGLDHTGLSLQLLHEEPSQAGEAGRPRQELQVSLTFGPSSLFLCYVHMCSISIFLPICVLFSIIPRPLFLLSPLPCVSPLSLLLPCVSSSPQAPVPGADRGSLVQT